MASGKRVLVITGLIVLVGAGGYGIYRMQGPSAAPPAAAGQAEGPRQRATPIVAMAAVRQAVPLEIAAIGQVTPWQTVSVKSRIDGQIVAVNFKPGDEVKPGQVLFKLDDRQLTAQLHQAQATLASDKAKLANAQSDFQRFTNMGEFATRQSVDTQKALVAQLQATNLGDQAQIDNLTVQLTYTEIKAPIEGRAGDVLLTVGNNVKANDTISMVTINQLHPIAVQFAVPQKYFAVVRQVITAGTAQALADPPAGTGKRVEGSLVFLDNAIDSTTGTFQVKGQFANEDSALWPGMFVNVTVRLGTDQNALVVPNAAVMTGQQGSYAYVVKPDNTVEARPVKVARTTPTVSVIETGLQDGEQVVVDGQLRITNGTKVELRKPDAAPVVANQAGAAQAGSGRGGAGRAASQGNPEVAAKPAENSGAADAPMVSTSEGR